MIPLIFAFLYRIGGAGWKPFGKNWRRIGIPILTFLVLSVSGAGVVKSLLTAALLLAALRLPLTFYGSSIPSCAFNWIWLWLAGYLLGLASVVTHGWQGLIYYSCIPAMTQGVLITLSNIPETAKDFPHEACELAIGFSVALAVL